MFGEHRPKPDARMLRRLLVRLRCAASRCVLVEDTLSHQKSARRLGMRTVWMQAYLGLPSNPGRRWSPAAGRLTCVPESSASVACIPSPDPAMSAPHAAVTALRLRPNSNGVGTAGAVRRTQRGCRSAGMLLVADMHIGKALAFRRLGVPVPHGTTAETLARLEQRCCASIRRSAGRPRRPAAFERDAHADGDAAAAARWRDEHRADRHDAGRRQPRRACRRSVAGAGRLVDEPWLLPRCSPVRAEVWRSCHHPRAAARLPCAGRPRASGGRRSVPARATGCGCRASIRAASACCRRSAASPACTDPARAGDRVFAIADGAVRRV